MPCWLSWLCCVGLPVTGYSLGTKQCVWTVWNRRTFTALATSVFRSISEAFLCVRSPRRPSFLPPTGILARSTAWSGGRACSYHVTGMVRHTHSCAEGRRWKKREASCTLQPQWFWSWLNINTHSLYWKGDTTVSQSWTPSVSTLQHVIHFPCLNRSCPHFTTAVLY